MRIYRCVEGGFSTSRTEGGAADRLPPSTSVDIAEMRRCVWLRSGGGALLQNKGDEIPRTHGKSQAESPKSFRRFRRPRSDAGFLTRDARRRNVRIDRGDGVKENTARWSTYLLRFARDLQRASAVCLDVGRRLATSNGDTGRGGLWRRGGVGAIHRKLGRSSG